MSDSEDQYVRANRESVEAFERDNARIERLTDAEIEDLIDACDRMSADWCARALRQQQAEIVALRQKLAAHAVMGDEIDAIADTIEAALHVLVEAAR